MSTYTDYRLENIDCKNFELFLKENKSDKIYTVIPLSMGSMLIMRKNNSTIESIIIDNDDMGQYGNNDGLLQYIYFTKNYTIVHKKN